MSEQGVATTPWESPEAKLPIDKNTPPAKSSWWNLARLRRILPFLGPAFMVSVGYMDPGNWATNIQAGSDFGYTLLWVLVLSNLMAQLLQALSAKLGLATGMTLAEMCRERFSRPVALVLWVAAEVAMMATDLAEFLGAALGFYILLGIPMVPAGLLTAAVVFGIMGLSRFGYRPVEGVILALVAVVGGAYAVEVALAQPDTAPILAGTFIPQIGSDSIYVALGMLGATVMPHNLYLHSGLIQNRLRDVKHQGQQKKLYRMALIDSTIAMNGAFFINAAMVVMAAAVFHRNGLPVGSIEEAHQTLAPLLGSFSSVAFALALLAAGLSSSVTGTLAGQIVLEGFLNIKVPQWVARSVTMLPALAVIALGLDTLKVLVLSQVVLSLQLPFAVIPLVLFTRDRKIMGDFANSKLVNWLAYGVTALIVGLNAYLLYATFFG